MGGVLRARNFALFGIKIPPYVDTDEIVNFVNRQFYSNLIRGRQTQTTELQMRIMLLQKLRERRMNHILL